MNESTHPRAGNPSDAIRQEGIDRIAGIVEAGVCPAAQQIHLVFDPSKITDEEVVKQAKRLEPYLKQRFEHCLYALDGRACEACALKLEKKAERIPGVRRASASYIGGILSVQFDQEKVAESALLQQLLDSGAPVKPFQPKMKPAETGIARWASWLTVRPAEAALTIGTLALIIAGWVSIKYGGPGWATWLLLGGAYAAGGWHGIQSAWNSLRNGTIDVDLLMVLAALGAAFVGAPIEGAVLLFLFSLSHLLQHGAMDHARNAIQALMKLRPTQALVRRDGNLVLLPIDSLALDDLVIVRPGESVPLDGIIVQGESALDESTLTGESIPANKRPGDPVFGGTMNTSGGLEVKVTRLARDSALSRLIKMVELAQSEKASAQRFLEKAEQYYAAGVILLTLALIALPAIIGDEPFDKIFYRAMTVMVVASPCALVISTPASILSAIGGAARNGVLFKGGAHLERAAEIRVVAFDKTGTLTRGRPEVTSIVTAEGPHTPKALTPKAGHLLSTAAAVEIKSEHPLAKAVVAAAQTAGLSLEACEHFQALPGQGVKGMVGGCWILLGDPRMFAGRTMKGLDLFSVPLAQLQAQGKSVILVAEQCDAGADYQLLGLIALADQLRPDAAAIVQQLKANGIERIVMLTGDHRNVAESIGRDAGVDEVHAELMPEDKWRIIQSLKESGPVAMVGDGINDAPALASADIGIAMGAAGTDVAMETADIVVMGDQLKTIAYAFSISRAARRVVIQNISFAAGVIALLLVGALGFQLPLPVGVIGHEGSTVLVCLNGLRLIGHKPKTSLRAAPTTKLG